ncbi:MAG: heavy-metal-associated domain-containing protein [Eubacteriales bacterium]
MKKIIGKSVKKLHGVAEIHVKYLTGHCEIAYHPDIISMDDIISTIETLGYKVVDDRKRNRKNKDNFDTLLGIGIVLLAEYLIINILSDLILYRKSMKIWASCNNRIIFNNTGEELTLHEGNNHVDLYSGRRFSFNCWMGMLNGYVRLVEDVDDVNLEQLKDEIIDGTSSPGTNSEAEECCD